MRILYVTALIKGFDDILRGDSTAKGLPSFILPLEALCQAGDQVDIILTSNYREKININVDWISNENILANINNDLVTPKGIKKKVVVAKSVLELLLAVNKALKTRNYDFVYCHGTSAIIGNILANIYRVPCGYRMYGAINMCQELRTEKNLSVIRNNFTHYIMYKLPKNFVLMTNDGTKGDYVFSRWKPRNKPYPFYFWNNGVNIQGVDSLEDAGVIPNHDYIFHANRLASKKGQTGAINILHYLDILGMRVHLYIAGNYDDIGYCNELKKMVNDYNLDEYVHFMGSISRDYLKKMAYYSVASISWNDISNDGNVFKEMFSTGAIIVCRNDGSIDYLAKDGENIFLADSEQQAANTIKKLINSSIDERNLIRANAISTSNQVFDTWENRVNKEVELIHTFNK